MKNNNNVTLFSNGIGHFRRVYTVSSKEESISIPFKSDCIGDVAASLQVFGRVRLNTPPSFTPANSHATVLRIDQNDALKSMLRQLSGSQIRMKIRGENLPINYTLLGLESETSVLNEFETISITYIVVMGLSGSFKRFLLTDVFEIYFEEEGVRTEINKALKSNFQKIKPDSTLLDLSLSSLDGEEVEAIVQYTIPVAAWKMRYAIREDKGKFSLDGAAIIDNNTDEDWNDFSVSVVTGNPISFNTDIANVVVPQRKMVYLVDRLALSNVDAEEGMLACSAPRSRSATRSLGPKMSTANYASFGLESVCDGVVEEMDVPSQYLAAEAPGVESKDVGDFCVFTAKEPITILARKSAVVPMFSRPLDSAGVVLLYKETNNTRRPYRSVKFKNETEYTLGRGKTVIYNEGLFSGECVLENTKPGENRMLPHCLENGVKIVKELKGIQHRRSSLKLSEGIVATEDVQTGATYYTVENKKDELFKVALEHTNLFSGVDNRVDFEGVEIKEKEKLIEGNGWRIYFELKPKESHTVVVSETLLIQNNISLGNSSSWIQNNIAVDSPLASDEQIMVCVNIQKEIDEVQENIQTSISHLSELNEQVNRVRGNLSAAKNHASFATIERWVQDLDVSEADIRTINKKTTPELSLKKKKLLAKLSGELMKISISWRES